MALISYGPLRHNDFFYRWPTGVSPIFGLYRVNRFLTSNTEAGTCNGRTLMVISVRVRYAYIWLK